MLALLHKASSDVLLCEKVQRTLYQDADFLTSVWIAVEYIVMQSIHISSIMKRRFSQAHRITETSRVPVQTQNIVPT